MNARRPLSPKSGRVCAACDVRSVTSGVTTVPYLGPVAALIGSTNGGIVKTVTQSGQAAERRMRTDTGRLPKRLNPPSRGCLA